MHTELAGSGVSGDVAEQTHDVPTTVPFICPVLVPVQAATEARHLVPRGFDGLEAVQGQTPVLSHSAEVAGQHVPNSLLTVSPERQLSPLARHTLLLLAMPELQLVALTKHLFLSTNISQKPLEAAQEALLLHTAALSLHVSLVSLHSLLVFA
jgi:hypothetical protein